MKKAVKKAVRLTLLSLMSFEVKKKDDKVLSNTSVQQSCVGNLARAYETMVCHKAKPFNLSLFLVKMLLFY